MKNSAIPVVSKFLFASGAYQALYLAYSIYHAIGDWDLGRVPAPLFWTKMTVGYGASLALIAVCVTLSRAADDYSRQGGALEQSSASFDRALRCFTALFFAGWVLQGFEVYHYPYDPSLVVSDLANWGLHMAWKAPLLAALFMLKALLDEATLTV